MPVFLFFALVVTLINAVNGQQIAPRAFGDIAFFTDANCSQRWVPSLDSTAYSYASWFGLLETDVATVDQAGNMTNVPCLQPRYSGLQIPIYSAQFQCSADKPYYDPNLNETLTGQAIYAIEYFNSTSCNAPVINQTHTTSANQTWKFFGPTGSCLKGTYSNNGQTTNLTARIQCHFTGSNDAQTMSLSLMIIATTLTAVLLVL